MVSIPDGNYLCLFTVGRLEILGISVDLLDLMKTKFFSREYTASVLPF